jgi:DNA polymerase lambda
MEIVKTGALRRIEYESTEEVKVIKLFTGIYGVGKCTHTAKSGRSMHYSSGPDIARKWHARGCRTLDDLREGQGEVVLSSCQQIGLRYYDGQRMHW